MNTALWSGTEKSSAIRLVEKYAIAFATRIQPIELRDVRNTRRG